MADELLDLELDDNDNELQDKVSKSEKRIKDLSEKVKLTSQERDEKDQLLAKEQAEKSAALKEAEFYKGFNTIQGKYQGSADFQDKIKEKFTAGYSIEDATVSVLNAEGKFNPTAPAAELESPTGGSAVNAINQKGDKKVSDMTRPELREQLEGREAELRDLIAPKFRV